MVITLSNTRIIEFNKNIQKGIWIQIIPYTTLLIKRTGSPITGSEFVWIDEVIFDCVDLVKAGK